MLRRRILPLAVAFGLAAGAVAVQAPIAAAASRPPDVGCHLDGAQNGIQHVIHLTFDNVHFTRDNPNVPSDLEQMPHLLDFLQSNGTVDTNHHTPLIAHTGGDILTALTGVYGDRMGQPISNSYRYYNPSGTSNPAVSFAYWTDGVFDPTTATPSDAAPTMVTPAGKNPPAPWVPFTRAGCDVGSVASANTVLENIGPDVPKVFGAGSPEVAEATSDPALATTDFVGIGVHCATTSALCAKGHARPDLLPDEPGGYSGYQGLFGAKYVNPAISPSGPVKTADGKTTITDSAGRPGFPGFDGMSAANSLGYIAAMQEAGVPVTYGYLSDAHDRHPSGGAYGPGEAGYVAALKDYDNAFGAFFSRLNRDGITPDNTLFIVTSDENDHFVGGKPSPASCDGVTTPCGYSQLGEINANVRGLLATQQHVTTPFQVHADSAPNFYLDGNPAASAPATRDVERAVSKLTAVNPISGATDTVTNYVADKTEMGLLHMVTGDPLRTPTFTAFADPNYYLYAGASNCTSACVALGPGFAWNHGDFAPDINRTWLGIVGPGVLNLGATNAIWSDHTDIRPTMLTLLGLHDDYVHDGRALYELIESEALPEGLQQHRRVLRDLATTLKQLNACVGDFGAATLKAATKGAVSASPGDQTYLDVDRKLAALGAQRDVVVGKMLGLLDKAEFHDGSLDEHQARDLTKAGHALLDQAHQLSA